MMTKFRSQPHLPDVNEFSHSLDLYFDDSAIDEHKSISVNENTQHMMTTSIGNILLDLCDGNPPVTGGFPSQRPVTRSFDVFFDMRMNKRLSKQSRCRWFETPPSSLWCHCNIDEITSVWNVISVLRHSSAIYDVTTMHLHIQYGIHFVYRKTSNINRTLVGNKIVDNSDVVGASPVGAAPTTSLFST